jgi:hypothetical protein
MLKSTLHEEAPLEGGGAAESTGELESGTVGGDKTQKLYLVRMLCNLSRNEANVPSLCNEVP